ncbi:MAG: CocE/NonD family hydrolase [candidate division WOR-3 bacterium]
MRNGCQRVLTVAALLQSLVITQAQAFIKETRMVRMRDGIQLATDIYYPVTSLPPWPTILQRTPYNRDIDSLLALLITDVKGYALVSQNLRGTGGSQGEPMLFLTDGWGALQDGYDCIEWIAAQWWSNDKIGMFGASAPGMTQYYAAGALPPHLTCTAPIVAGPSLYHHVAYTGGEFRKALVETWLNAQHTPWLIDSVANHPLYTPDFWGTVDLRTRWGLVNDPQFHVGGWYDMYTDGQLEAFTELQRRHHNQKLFIGPWGHYGFNEREQGDLTYPANAEILETEYYTLLFEQWYDPCLQGSGNIGDRVTYYLMGDCDTQDTTNWNHWVKTDTWPPPDAQYTTWYLRQGGVLSQSPPVSAEPPDTFRYDPRDPCPTIGGREYIGIPGGYGPKDQRPLESRPDVKVYTTPPLAQPLKVVGKLRLLLYASSDRTDTDWAVRVSDVYPDGRSILMTDNILKARHRKGFDREDFLTPGVVDTFDIDLWSIANVWNQGHRLRVSITSSNFPRFERNPNTGGPFRRNDTAGALVATNVIFHSPGIATRLLLPVIGGPVAMEEKTPRLTPGRCEVCPNPFVGSARVPGYEHDWFTLLDIAGREVGECRGDRVGAKLAPGVYFLKHHAADMSPLRLLKMR